MNFDLTEDQALLKAAVERFVSDSYGGDLEARRAARITPAGFSTANWARLAESGILALPVSAANGGLGGGRVELAACMEALGRGLVAEPVLDAAIIPGKLLDGAGATAPLDPLMAGTTLVALAHAEREARYNLAHVGTTARAKGDKVVIDGIKSAVLAGGTADVLIVSARLSGGTRDRDGIGFFQVPANAPGVDRRSYRLADGSVAAEIALRGVEVAASAQLAEGLDTLTPAVATARLAAAAEMLGLMTLLFDNTLSFVKTRTQFGQSLGSFQVIQHRMTDAYVLVEQARSQVVRAALTPAEDFARAAAGAKAFVAEAALTVAHTAVQMHGGMGITDELVIGHALKRIRVLALTFGDATAALDDYRRAA
ncbi:acyl-CoA dehydrogenase family protein [Sandarakinorhabdus sp. DWP1-3-1]|uniref:acyl-CoA dehydrogenase family protein n=1 Tax=Sandarakinorhabdus sp. DWP1-3-1 TaxID=2804627 RepID=UPI003CF0848D